ncbi:Pentatricopeptide repeat-containing protein [Thalictrum thalictroides]|uniref:Pentatricopeptide repeat-containing protein n=1 Tax=Thalictrum thalictroides TaxID=46969 RepID=A0A7J6WPR2_THATH|nr:Pentatricopeptide repeat-containing protein [Thalictrum thalictroides]
MEIIMANGQMGMLDYGRTWTFTSRYSIHPSPLQGFSKISLNPNCSFGLNKEKMKKKRILSVKAAELIDSGKSIEKQFEFQPAFDDYLKAMESVKTGRDMKPVKDASLKENFSGKDVWRVSTAMVEVEERYELGSERDSGRVRRKEGEQLPEKSQMGRQKSGNGSEDDRDNGAGKSTIHLDSRGGISRQNGVGSIEEPSKRHKIGYKERSNGVMKESSNLDKREGFPEKGEIRSRQDSSYRKLEYRENDMYLSNGRGLPKNEDDENINIINRRSMNDVTSEFDATQRTAKDNRLSGSYRKTNAVNRHRRDEDLRGGGRDQKRNYSDIKEKKLNSNNIRRTTHVRKVERATDFTGIANWKPERQQSNRSSIESKTSDSALNLTLMNWEGVSRNDTKMGPDATESRENMHKKRLFRRSEVHSQMYDSESWKALQTKELSRRNEVYKQTYDSDFSIRDTSKSSYGIQSNISPNKNMFQAENMGLRRTKTDVEFDRSFTHSEISRHKSSLKSGKFNSSKFPKEEVDNDMEMERAAFKSFEVFTDLRGQPRVLRMEMEERIQNLAKWLNGADINMPEWLFSKMIHSARIRFSDYSILRVIQILGTLGNWRRVLQVIEWFQSRERFKSHKSRYIYTAVLDVLGKAKRPVEALNVFHAMRQGMSSYPDLPAYHCIAVTLGQAGHIKELFDVIDCMRSPPENKFKTGLVEKWDPRLEPDIIVYNAVLNACARRKQWEGAFWVLQQLKQQGLQPSSTTYGLTMEVMFACEKYKLVYEFFRKVEKSTIPNSLNYKVLLNTLWKEGKTDDAVFAVQDMERRGIVGSASLYYDLARCLCTAGRCQEALMQMDKICKVARKPLVVTYTGLIQACLDTGNVQNGAYIFKQMQEFCAPNLVTCNIMLKAYLDHRMFEDAKDLFHKMLDDSSIITRKGDYKNTVIPDSYTFNTMLDACATEQKWEDLKNVFQEMFRRGYYFNTKRHLGIIMEACRAGKGELLELTWKHLVQANRIPPPPLLKERFCMKLEKNDYTSAISSITNHPTNDLKMQAFSEKGWLDLLEANKHRLQKDTILKLTLKLNNLVAGSDHPHPVVQNLISSCKEFIRTHNIAAAEINHSNIQLNSEHMYVI